MQKIDLGESLSKGLITGLMAVVATCSTVGPAFSSEPTDGTPLFRGATGQAVTSTAQSPVADNTILVLLNPNSNVSKVKGFLANEAHAQTIHEMHVNGDNYSVLQVSPQAGQREATLNKINSMIGSHSELSSAGRNYKVKMLTRPFDRVPNDPEISQQWPLANMRWFAARSRYGTAYSGFAQSPHITILADGCDPVTTNNELGYFVSQYNALDPNVTPFPEAVQGSFASGGGEGDVDTSITGCLTDNATLIAGSGSFSQDFPCYLTMLRMTTTDSVSSANIYNALAWAVNNQSARGGHGPVNLSYGSAFPSIPLWSDPMIQAFGRSLKAQGDVLIIAAGDTPGTYPAGFAPGSTCVVQGTAQNNYFFDGFLTLLQNDAFAAPGAVQPAVLGGEYHDDFFGSSFSAPHISSLVATLIAINPNLSSARALQIIQSTGTPVNRVQQQTWNAYIPAWDRAMAAAYRLLR